MTGKTAKGRPSDKRRQILKNTEANKVPHISNLTPIERYYDVADKLKQLFESNFSDHKLNEAYIYGIRYAKFCTDALPQHDYYKAPKRELTLLRQQNRRDLKEVIDALEEVVQLMDLEELEKAEIQRREEAALRKIREREALMRKEEEDRRAQKELMDRLNALDTMFPKPPTGVGESQTKAELPSYEQAQAIRDQLHELPINGDFLSPIPFTSAPELQESLQQDTGGMAPPPPPSYDDLIKQKSRFSNYEKDSIAKLRPASSTSSRDLMNDPITQNMNFDNSQEPATLVNPLGKFNVVIKKLKLILLRLGRVNYYLVMIFTNV